MYMLKEAKRDTRGYPIAPSRALVTQWVSQAVSSIDPVIIIRSAVATGSARKCDYSPEIRAKYNLDAIKIDPVIADLVGEEASERV